MLQPTLSDNRRLEISALLHEELAEHRRTFEATAISIAAPFQCALDLLERSIRQGGKILLFGNGGSAADAQHTPPRREVADDTKITSLRIRIRCK